jgi:hypothetical protein
VGRCALLDFVEYLLEWSRSSPLFVLTLARPELLDKRPNWGAGHRNFTSLHLGPLSETAMAELLDGFVPGLPDALREQILARAEGVPLYAVEPVRMLLDKGLLVQEGSIYRPTGEIPSLDVPETLHGLVASRLDGLPAAERRLLQDAAVLGKTFTRQGLAAVGGLSEAELDPLLASLARKEILGVQADPTSPEHGQYGFSDLVTISGRSRRSAASHLAAAYLVDAFPEDEITASWPPITSMRTGTPRRATHLGKESEHRRCLGGRASRSTREALPPSRRLTGRSLRRAF